MKNIFFSIIALATVAAITVSCNQSSNKNSDQQANDSTTISGTQNLPSSTQNDTDSVCRQKNLDFSLDSVFNI